MYCTVRAARQEVHHALARDHSLQAIFVIHDRKALEAISSHQPQGALQLDGGFDRHDVARHDLNDVIPIIPSCCGEASSDANGFRASDFETMPINFPSLTTG